MRLILISIIVISVFLSGCMNVRTYTVEKPRIDTEVSGNQGFLSGTASSAPKKSKFGKTRKISVFEIEFGPKKTNNELEEEEEDSSQPPAFKDDYREVSYDDQVEYIEEIDLSEIDAPQQEYLVKKNDTLQKISYQFYGTTKKWKALYEANKDLLKSSDRLYPGVKLRIPAL